MRTNHLVGSAVVVGLFFAQLVVLAGCGGQADLALDQAESEPSETKASPSDELLDESGFPPELLDEPRSDTTMHAPLPKTVTEPDSTAPPEAWMPEVIPLEPPSALFPSERGPSGFAAEDQPEAMPAPNFRMMEPPSITPAPLLLEDPEPDVAFFDPEPTPGEPESGTKDDDYEIVTVFYGTDRNAMEAASTDWEQYTSWYYAMLGLATLALVLVSALVRFWRNRAILVVAGTGLTVVVVLAVVTTLARLQSETVGPRPDQAYGNDRGELVMGTCEVSIPKKHEVGEVERPSVFRLEFQEDPREHVVVLGIEEQASEQFFADLRARVNASAQQEAFVFVHGFNVTFDASARRTAQLAHDLEFDGAPIFYSWPSQGGLLQYAVDETNAAWTVPHLKEFLVGVARQSGARSVHLIAHSMGNRALTTALQSLAYEFSDEQPMFHQILLTAPDIDADVFRRDIAPAIVKTAGRVTLYASSNDEALAMSKKFHGYARAGDSDPQLIVVPGIDTIDVSSVDTSLLGHSYYGSNQTVIADMLDLLNGAKPPDERRWLETVRLDDLVYWVFHGDPTQIGEIFVPQPPVQW